ncbi:MAG: response regulator, partial [Gluconacetobacter diazotrophicus]|nr:response regulator [Gluconacetobacter diazotrophicus]
QVMTGYLELSLTALNRDQVDVARLTRQLENVQASAKRAATLTQQLLAFSRKQRLEGRSLNLNDTVRELDELTKRTLGEEIALHSKLGPGLWNCRVDPSQCELALLNVLINARDALEGRPEKRVTIETRNVEVGPEDVANFAGLPPGRYAAVSVTDTGCGMPEEVRSRVMDPFFTTKEEGKGTGLGLSMVYGFAKQSGGAVRIYSEEGVGTTVRIYFPATDGEVARAAEAQARAMDRGGSELILVVEDRQEVGDLAEAFLADYGYRILRAADGRQALALLDREPSINLLFSDLIMPGGMNGVVLAREARRRRPRLRILLTTGYAEASLERVDAGGSEFEIIDKPYRQQELARKVRLVLDGPTGVG